MKGIPTQITSLIKNEKFQDLISDLNETILDSLLEDGVLKDVPIFGLILKSKNLYTSIQDRLFSKKLFTFLKQLENVSVQDRITQIERIDNNENYRTKVGEKILFIINQAEDSEKSEYIGRLFKAFIEAEITYEDFLKATDCINRTNIIDLKEFLGKLWLGTISPHYSEPFLNTGLLIIKYENTRKNRSNEIISDTKIDLKLSKIGQVIEKILGAYPKDQNLQ